MKVYGFYGQFNLNPSKVARQLHLLGNKYVAGFTARFTWREITKYGWENVDKIFDLAENVIKKPLNIILIAGAYCPYEIYEKGVDRFNFRYDELLSRPDNEDAATAVMPLPWNETYLGLWAEFLSGFADRYRDRLHLVDYIHVGGGGWQCEMMCPCKPEARARWLAAGYTDQKIITAWKTIISTFVSLFPKNKLKISMGEPLGRGFNVMPEVIRYAKDMGLSIQFNGLSHVLEDWNLHMTRQYRHAIRRLTMGPMEKRASAGYQTKAGVKTAGSTDFDRKVKTMCNVMMSDCVGYAEIHMEILERMIPELPSELKCLAQSELLDPRL